MSEAVTLQVLLVEADPEAARRVAKSVTGHEHAVETVSSSAAAARWLQQHACDVVIASADHEPIGDGDLLDWLGHEAPDVDVILMMPTPAVAEAVTAIRRGATDLLGRPVDAELLAHALERIAENRTLRQQLVQARSELETGVYGPVLVGRSKAMTRLFDRLERIARSDAPVLIRGESGTGKELVARMLHARSPRAEGPFVAINCAAFPDTLLEAELFGHERGAFTGATKRRKGRFQAAHGGTLFLDEVAELPPQAQAKLLRVLAEGTVEMLGSNEVFEVDVRILSATHRDLKDRMAQHLFREDLYYRLKVLDVAVPPLRERMSDLPLLVEHFVRRMSQSETSPQLTARAWSALKHYDFPGNVRELEHAIQHALVLSDGVIDIGHLPAEIAGDVEPAELEQPGFPRLSEAMRDYEREYLVRALHLADGSRTRAAQLLGISRKNLWEKLKGHGLADLLKKKGDG